MQWSYIRQKRKDYFTRLFKVNKNSIIVVFGFDSTDRVNGEEFLYEYIYSFNYSGKMIDRLQLINGNWNPDIYWQEYVVLSPSEFKIFKYVEYVKNPIYNEKTKDVETEKSTQCTIEDYRIDESGKIKKVKSEVRYLKNPSGYRVFDPKKYPDDPMNEY